MLYTLIYLDESGIAELIVKGPITEIECVPGKPGTVNIIIRDDSGYRNTYHTHKGISSIDPSGDRTRGIEEGDRVLIF
jgi:hypothetical protein